MTDKQLDLLIRAVFNLTESVLAGATNDGQAKTDARKQLHALMAEQQTGQWEQR